MTGSAGQPTEGAERTPPSSAVAQAASVLAQAGIGPARMEAQLLVAYVLGVPRSRLALADDLSPGLLARLGDLVDRRTRHEPLQHLLGTAAFRYLELAVGPGVFVPRPETELLAGWGIEAARRTLADPTRLTPPRAVPAGPTAPDGVPAGPTLADGVPAGPTPLGAAARSGPGPGPGAPEVLVVDLCSGTGAIALAVADEVPGARVVAVERAAAALAWLRRNAEDRARAGDRPVEVVPGDVADPALLGELAGRVDVLLSNPPYVPDGTAVPPEVADHDPAEAVFGGPDGLAVIRLVIEHAVGLLRPGGLLGIEHDDTHGETAPDLLRSSGRFVDVVDHLDLTGRPRFVTARRSD